MEKKNEGQFSCACLDTRKTLVVCNRVVTRKCQTCLADLRRVHNKLRLIAYMVLTRRLRQGRDVSRIIVDKIERPFMIHDGVYGNCALLTDLQYNVPLTGVKYVGVHFPGHAADINQDALLTFLRAHNFQTVQLDVSAPFITTVFLRELLGAMQPGTHLIFRPRYQLPIFSKFSCDYIHRTGIIRYQDFSGRKMDWVEMDISACLMVKHNFL